MPVSLVAVDVPTSSSFSLPQSKSFMGSNLQNGFIGITYNFKYSILRQSYNNKHVCVYNVPQCHMFTIHFQTTFWVVLF